MLPRIINALLGIWLMASPSALGYTGPARINDLIVGPVAASFAIIAIWEATRPLRWANLALGAWLVIAPWALGHTWAATINSSVVGVALALLSMAGRDVEQRFGGGWSSLFREDMENRQD